MDPTTTPTIRRLNPLDWAVFIGVVFFVTVIAAALLTSCGDDDDDSIQDPIPGNNWARTVDPYGREWACLNIVYSVGVGLFCAPAPETP